MAVKAHLQSGVTKITMKTGPDFLSSPTFTVKSRVDGKQTISLQHKVYFFVLQHFLCCVYVCLIQM